MHKDGPSYTLVIDHRIRLFSVVSICSIHLTLPCLESIVLPQVGFGVRFITLLSSSCPLLIFITFKIGRATFIGMMMIRILVDNPLSSSSSSSFLYFGVLTSPHRYSCRRPLLGLADQRLLLHTTQSAEPVVLNDMVLPAATKFMAINALTSQDDCHCHFFLWKVGSGSDEEYGYDRIVR